MGKLILLIALLVPGVATVSVATVSVAMANDRPKNAQPKPKAPLTTANPCAQYGPGFVQVQGTTTCVRMNGYIRTDGATSGPAR